MGGEARAAAPAVFRPSSLPRTLFFLLVTLSCCFQDVRSDAQGTLPQREVDALKAIALKLNIPRTLWDFRQEPCSGWARNWTRLVVRNLTCDCNSSTKVCRVVSIQLKGQNLTGVLPDEFGNLTYLTEIDLTRNYINGSIPAAAWASLPLLTIDLLGNRLSGKIPEAIGKITTLQLLDLGNNMLQGPLPRSLGNLTSLTELLLSANFLTGELPETLGNLKNLTAFVIDGNDISGKIPSLIGNWTRLEKLNMQGTSLEGPFPPIFSTLRSITWLRVADLKKTDGSFPPVRDMLNMKYLILRNCSISGQIPEYIGTMKSLRILYSSSDITFFSTVYH